MKTRTPVTSEMLQEAMDSLATATPNADQPLTVEGVLKTALPGCPVERPRILTAGVAAATKHLTRDRAEQAELSFALGISLGRELGH